MLQAETHSITYLCGLAKTQSMRTCRLHLDCGLPCPQMDYIDVLILRAHGPHSNVPFEETIKGMKVRRGQGLFYLSPHMADKHAQAISMSWRVCDGVAGGVACPGGMRGKRCRFLRRPAQAMVEEGKVKYLGLSEVAPADVRRAHAIQTITLVEM